MPNPIIPLPEFPNVAQLPGVPQLVRANNAINTLSLAVGAVSKFLGAASTKTVWGIFDQDGNAVIKPTSYLGFSNDNSWRIASFPLQDGEYSNFNKVVNPPLVSLKIAQSGSLQDRKNLLNKLQQIAGNLQKYNILVPEGTYLNYNIERYAIRRQGATGAYYFVDLEIFLQNIQETTSQYSNTDANTANAINPAALPPVNLGTQLPQISVLPSVQSAVNTALAGVPN
jgi:hypothetical protein